MPTTNFNLPKIDNTNTADVVRDMNALADAVDTAAKVIKDKADAAIPSSQKGAASGVATLGPDGKVPSTQLDISAPSDASTTQKGVVQLSSATSSTSEVLAATSKAVKDAKDGLTTQIGTLTSLNTAAKTSLVAAINEVNSKANTKASDIEVLFWMGAV